MDAIEAGSRAHCNELAPALVSARLLQSDRREGDGAPDGAGEGALAGEVVSHTFLGSVTRIKVEAGPGELTADVSTIGAETLPVGARVTARFPAESARLLTLAEEEEAPQAVDAN